MQRFFSDASYTPTHSHRDAQACCLSAAAASLPLPVPIARAVSLSHVRLLEAPSPLPPLRRCLASVTAVDPA